MGDRVAVVGAGYAGMAAAVTLSERGVPVMGHVGLTPQAINALGSFRAQGRDEADWAPIEADARAVVEAGAFAVVLEAVDQWRPPAVEHDPALPGRAAYVTTLALGQPPFASLQLFFAEDAVPAEADLPALAGFAARATHALREDLGRKGL